MNGAPSEAEQLAIRSEVWAIRDARTAVANAERLAAWEAKRPLILECDLPKTHTKQVAGLAVVPMKAGAKQQ